jgi:hypothetical protein
MNLQVPHQKPCISLLYSKACYTFLLSSVCIIEQCIQEQQSSRSRSVSTVYWHTSAVFCCENQVSFPNETTGDVTKCRSCRRMMHWLHIHRIQPHSPYSGAYFSKNLPQAPFSVHLVILSLWIPISRVAVCLGKSYYVAFLCFICLCKYWVYNT